MKDNRPNTDIQDKTSRPIHHSELALMFQRFVMMLDEDKPLEGVEDENGAEALKVINEFIIQENFRRVLFPRDEDNKK